ncbi:MAG TPA: palindromic element RPE4 domain-containing protein [Rickettsia endosymbiont of Ceroptres masudai]|nr:palindromic element RPE4 domain-containing protein [Rickettsia endosymbiont of Ceroptres masudai]
MKAAMSSRGLTTGSQNTACDTRSRGQEAAG